MQSDSPPTLNQHLIKAGVRANYASMLASGDRKPSLDLALDLEKKLGIPPAAWREGVEAVRAALAASPAGGSAS